MSRFARLVSAALNATLLKWSGRAFLLIALVTTALVVPWGANRLLRSYAVSKARARGVELSASSLQVRWRYVELSNVHASLEGVPALEVHVDRVQVDWSVFGSKKAARLVNPHVTVNSGLNELAAQLQEFRREHTRAPGAEGSSARQPTWQVAFEGGSFDCQPEKLTVTSMLGQLGEGLWRVAAAEVHAHYGSLSAVAHEVRAEGTSTTFDHAQIGRLALAAEMAERGASNGQPSNLGPPLNDEPKSDAVDVALNAVDRRIDAFLKRLLTAREGLKPGRWKGPTSLDVDSITLGIPPAVLGPWSLHVNFGDEAVAVQLDPSAPSSPTGAEAAEARRPLELRAIVPRAQGRIRIEARIGPASLAELGLQQGWFGLIDVDRATLEARGNVDFDPDERSFAAAGVLAIQQLGIQHQGLAESVVRGLDLAVRGTLTASPGLKEWSLSNGALELGALRTDVRADWVRTPAGLRMAADWSLPETPCADILSAVPAAMRPRLGDLRLDGTLGAHGSLRFDTNRLQDTDVQLSLAQRCRVKHVSPDLMVQRFHRPFELRVYGPRGEPKVARFGPGTESWTPLDRVSPYVTVALLTCEDAAFFSHEGFSALALRNALAANIRAGRFAQGGSTVTMQLAKNLFLDRHKRLGRKIEEAVLTIWLEQALSKDDILELYLNVVEFGPNLYGIGPAAQHYFGRTAAELDPLEAMFLVSILPSPVKRNHMRALGQPTDHYLDYLRRQLKLALERGRLEETEYAAVAELPLKFHREGEPMPAPRPMPVRRPEAAETETN